jgi:predicted esterase
MLKSIALIALLSTQCVSARQTDAIPKGQIVEKITCLDDPSQSYALYLPSNYAPERKWVILYAFDPGARGTIPVQRFKDAAEKYGWIVVGSNNSRNGPWDLAVNAWNAISRDTQQRFAIDNERAYAAGFSGGARVAVRIASLCNCIAGVIASGAGFPVGITPAASMHFLLFGVVGVDDFNFPELRSLDEPLTKAGLTHRIQTFDGGHAWPPASTASAAVEWMELQAMKAGKRPREAAFIDAMWQKEINEAKTLEELKQYNEAYSLYLDLAQSFKGMQDTGEVENKLTQLRDSRELKVAIHDDQEQISKQRVLERQLRALIEQREHFRLRDTSIEEDRDRPTADSNLVKRSEETVDLDHRLDTLLRDLQKRSEATADSSARRVARRTLDGLFIGFVEQGINLLQTQSRYGEAATYFKLATEIHPDRPGPQLLLASAYAANSEKKKAIRALKNAVDNGFSDLGAIMENKAFDSVRDDPQYQRIVERLKKAN